MRPPFPSAAQAYAESIDSATASRHHPNSRLTILPLPSLAALYPLDDAHPSSTSSNSSSSSHATTDAAYRRSGSLYGSQLHHQQHSHQQAPYQSFDKHFQKSPVPTARFTPSPSPAPSSDSNTSTETSSSKINKHEYMGTNMESLLDAVEVHATMFASASSSSSSSSSFSADSLSPATSPLSLPSSPSASVSDSQQSVTKDDDEKMTASKTVTSPDSHTNGTRTNSPSLRRMSISHLVDGLEPQQHQREECDLEPTLEDNHRPRLKPMLPRPSSPSLSTSHVTHKRKWSRLSTYMTTSEDSRSAKIRVDAPESGVTLPFNMMPVAEALQEPSPMRLSLAPANNTLSAPTRRLTTTISCYHASVAQKSYGSEKRFLCPPPIVHIQGDLASSIGSRPQVAMSVVCESGEGSTLGQRSTLEEDQTSTFRYLYVSGSAKQKSFQLKVQLYDRACLPNGFVSSDSSQAHDADTSSESELPEPYAVFDSQPIAIISKPSKKTAKARNVSSCILAGSLVSLFNRINSQTVRTKYMSTQDGGLCAKSSSWSAFTISIVSNGPSSTAPTRNASSKSHHRQPAPQNAAPITYGAEIILTETTTGLQSDRLIVCKVENGRIMEGAIGPICQMQKVALQSVERTQDGKPMYLGACGDDHQGGRFMDHSNSTHTVLKYETATMTENSKPGSDDFLCWTIVGISKFEYAV